MESLPDETFSAAGAAVTEWQQLLGDQPAYRSRQIYEALHKKGIRRWEEATNLPLSLRDTLKDYPPFSSHRIESVEQNDSIKIGIELHDGVIVESVLLFNSDGRKTACLSTQAGCAMACTFCQTGRLGFQRNLSAGEIIEQLWHLEELQGSLDNIVFMGMGEPFRNFDEWARSVEILCDPAGRGMSARRLTVSTCGIPEGINRLAKFPLPVHLAVSLTTADQTLRDELMPGCRRYPLAMLKETLQRYQQAGGKRVTLEMVLIDGRNDTSEEADKIARFARDLTVFVNVIPWNPVEGLPFREPPRKSVERFMVELSRRKVNAAVRWSRGRDTDGACGQLGSRLKDRTESPEA